VYTIPADSSTKQNIIWAFGTTNPGNKADDATLIQHLNSGTGSLDLTKSLSGGSTGTGSGSGSTTGGASPSSPTAPPPSQGNTASSLPFAPYQRMIIAHAVFMSAGFLLALPAGALLARYLRTYWPGWFQAHWIAQFALAAPAIIVGLALGVQAVGTAGAPHLNDDHKVRLRGPTLSYPFRPALFHARADVLYRRNGAWRSSRCTLCSARSARSSTGSSPSTRAAARRRTTSTPSSACSSSRSRSTKCAPGTRPSGLR
jgi:hypothetical protein